MYIEISRILTYSVFSKVIWNKQPTNVLFFYFKCWLLLRGNSKHFQPCMYIFIPVIKNKQTKKLSIKGTRLLEYLSEDSSEIPIIKNAKKKKKNANEVTLIPFQWCFDFVLFYLLILLKVSLAATHVRIN